MRIVLSLISATLMLVPVIVQGQGIIVDPSAIEPDATTVKGEQAATVDEIAIRTLEARVDYLRDELEKAQNELDALRGAGGSSSNGTAVASVTKKIPTGALVVVSSDDSEGSGFIGRLRERTFFVTNIHVLGSSRGARFTTIEGVEVPLTTTAFVSRRRDVAIVPIEWDGPVLEVSPSLRFDEVAIGEAVTVMGNSSGARVATSLTGEIQGIGPDELEVTAKFVPGNSGSPIVHNKLGTVVAVASHLRDFSEKNKWSDDSELGDIRRFGYRLDGEIEWQQISLEKLYTQSEIYSAFEDRTFAMYHIGYMLEYESQLMTNYRDHPSLGYLFNDISEGFDWERGTGSGHNQHLLRRFLKGLAIEVQKDIWETKNALDVSFYKKRFEDIQRGRQMTQKSIDHFMQTRL